MSTLGKAVIEFSADTATFTGDVGKAAAMFMKNMDRMEGGIKSLLGTAAGLASAGGFVAMIKSSVDANDKLQDLSKSTGIAIETLGGLGFAASQSGSSLEGIGKAVGKLNLHIAEAKSGTPEMVKIFQNLGLSVKDLSTLSPDQVFARIADVFAKTEDGANKAAYGNKLFGKSYQDIIPTLDEGGDRIRKNIEYYQKYSGVTEDLAKRSDEFNDEMTKLHLLSGAFATTLTAKLLPGMQDLVKEIVRFKEESAGATTVADGIIEVFKVIGVVGAETAFTFNTIGKELARFVENAKLIATGDWEGSKRLGQMFADDAAKARKEVDALTARIMAFNTVKAKTPLMDDDEWARARMGANTKKGGLPNLPQKAEPVTLFERTLQSLTKEYYNLTHAGKLAMIQWEEQYGTLKKLTPEERKQIEAMAAKIDAYNRMIIVQQEAVKLVEIQTQALEAARNLGQEYADARRHDIEEMQFQNSLLGLSVMAQEQMNAARRIDLELRAKIRALPGDESTDNSAAIQQFNKDAEAQTRTIQKLIATRQELERSALMGQTIAVNKYLDEIGNSAAQTERLFTNTFKSMEDALVEFAMTGKLDFKSLADSIIRDIIRIDVQRKIMAPLVGTKDQPGILSQGLGGIANWLTGGGPSANPFTGGVGAVPYASGTDYVPADQLAWLHRGEAVLTPDENRNRGGGDVYITMNQNFGSDVDRGTLIAWGEQVKRDTIGAVRQMGPRGMR